jgi:ribosomal protein L40E
MALSGDRESDPELPPGHRWATIEVDGNLQPWPKDDVATRMVNITEEPLWETEIKGAALSLDTSIKLKLTTLRAIRDDQWLMLKDCDIVVTNKTAQNVGDIRFTKQGAPAIVFTQIKDPDRIAAMAVSAKEQVLAFIEKVQAEAKAEEEAIARLKAKGINDLICSRCTRKNPLGSKFCRHCGSALS